MGGAKKAKPTSQEIEQSRIHAEQWARYKEVGVPLENEWIRRTTGYTFDNDAGEYVVDTSAGVRREDGSVVTDTSAADSANERAYGQVLNQASPNRLEQATSANREGAIQGGISASGMALNQQRNAQVGLVNAVARGKGLEGEAMARQDQLAAQAQQEAFAAADASASKRATNSYLVGNLGGLAGITYKNRLDGLDSRQAQHPEFDPTVTKRRAGDHHS